MVMTVTNSVITFFKVVMLGLDAAGKTTILYRLHMGEVLSTVPTVGRWPVSLFVTYLPTTLNHWGVSWRSYPASWLVIFSGCMFANKTLNPKDCSDWKKGNNSKSWPMFGWNSRLLGRSYLILIGVDLETFVYITS